MSRQGDQNNASNAPSIPSLRVITEANSTLDHHCSICHFFHGQNDEGCQHMQQRRSTSGPVLSSTSDGSFYSTRTSASMDSGSSRSTMKAKIKPSRRPDSPPLRHKPSPTSISLRNLRQQQLQQAAAQRRSSDERLCELYEAQILEYLGGPYATLDRIEE